MDNIKMYKAVEEITWSLRDRTQFLRNILNRGVQIVTASLTTDRNRLSYSCFGDGMFQEPTIQGPHIVIPIDDYALIHTIGYANQFKHTEVFQLNPHLRLHVNNFEDEIWICAWEDDREEL